MTSKRVILAALCALLLVSCSDKAADKKPAPSSGEIINNYKDTLVNAPKKAQEAAEAARMRNEKMEEEINK